MRKVVKNIPIKALEMNDKDLHDYIDNLPELPFTGLHMEDKTFCPIAADFFKGKDDYRSFLKRAIPYLKRIEI